jgi:hypothetical protein
MNFKFIFSNFNGTSDDVDVLTHEAGHAFQVYQSRNIEMPEYVWPTLEACEIHSMSMEFFAWPWMDKFFAEETGKYRFAHLSAALLFHSVGGDRGRVPALGVCQSGRNAGRPERKIRPGGPSKRNTCRTAWTMRTTTF